MDTIATDHSVHNTRASANANAPSDRNLDHVYFFLEQTTDMTHPGSLSGPDAVYRATICTLNHPALGSDVTTVARCEVSGASNNSVASNTTVTAPQQTHSRDSSPTSIDTGSGRTIATTVSSNTSSNLNATATTFSPGKVPAPSHSDAASPPEPVQLFEARQVSGKGLGLVAIRPIPRGTRILKEEPLLSIQQNLPTLTWEAYTKLVDADKETFDKLHKYSSDPEGLENTSRLGLTSLDYDSLDDDGIDKLVEEQVRVMSIFSANCFNLVPEGVAVYATVSRLNHSCVPNTYHGYNPNTKSFNVHAVREIAEGEELTINYIGTDATYLVRSQRVQHLRTHYGFTCNCLACSDRTGTSDSRRIYISNIGAGLDAYERGQKPEYPYIPAGPEEAFTRARDAVTFMNDESLHGIDLTTVLRAASRYAVASKDWPTALRFALNEQEVELNILGTEVQDLRALGSAASIWVEEVATKIRENMGKKQAKGLLAQYSLPPGFGVPKPAAAPSPPAKKTPAKRCGHKKTGKTSTPPWKGNKASNDGEGSSAGPKAKAGKKETADADVFGEVQDAHVGSPSEGWKKTKNQKWAEAWKVDNAEKKEGVSGQRKRKGKQRATETENKDPGAHVGDAGQIQQDGKAATEATEAKEEEPSKPAVASSWAQIVARANTAGPRKERKKEGKAGA